MFSGSLGKHKTLQQRVACQTVPSVNPVTGSLSGRIQPVHDKALRTFYQSKEQTDLHDVVMGLNELAPKHVYFELLRLSWLEKLDAVDSTAPRDYQDLLPHKKISKFTSTGLATIFSVIVQKNSSSS